MPKTKRLKDELLPIQSDYINNKITFQEFKEKSIAIIVAHSDIKDIEEIVADILEN